MMFTRRKVFGALAGLFLAAQVGAVSAEPLKIGYSDWPGWVAWDVAIEKWSGYTISYLDDVIK